MTGNKTECPVPGGKIDTRSISGTNKRVHNNRLEGNGDGATKNLLG